MQKIYTLTSAKIFAAMVGLLICSHGWAEDKPSPGAGKIQSQVSCDLSGTSLTCKATDKSFIFYAHMQMDISTGSNGNGTITFEVPVSKYMGFNCTIDLDPSDFDSVSGEIWCNNHRAVLKQPVQKKHFAEKVHGDGDFSQYQAPGAVEK